MLCTAAINTSNTTRTQTGFVSSRHWGDILSKYMQASNSDYRMTFKLLIKRRLHTVCMPAARYLGRYVARVSVYNKVSKTWQCKRFTVAQSCTILTNF